MSFELTSERILLTIDGVHVQRCLLMSNDWIFLKMSFFHAKQFRRCHEAQSIECHERDSSIPHEVFKSQEIFSQFDLLKEYIIMLATMRQFFEFL